MLIQIYDTIWNCYATIAYRHQISIHFNYRQNILIQNWFNILTHFCGTSSSVGLISNSIVIMRLNECTWLYWNINGRYSVAFPSLTHWGRDKMATIFQTTFSNAFSWMKMYEFRLRFHWSLFLRLQLQYSSIGSDNGLAPSRRQAIIWSNAG